MSCGLPTPPQPPTRRSPFGPRRAELLSILGCAGLLLAAGCGIVLLAWGGVWAVAALPWPWDASTAPRASGTPTPGP